MVKDLGFYFRLLLHKVVLTVLPSILAIAIFSMGKNESFSMSESISKKRVEAFNTAEQARINGRFNEALDLFNRALNLAQESNYVEGKLDTLLKVAILYWNMGRMKESAESYKQALSIAQKLNSKNAIEICSNSLEIYDHYNEGKKFRSLGNHQKSIDDFAYAINLANKMGAQELELKCLRQLSLTYRDLNNYQEFYFLNKKALFIAQEINHKQEEARCLNNLGLFYRQIDNYSEALKDFEMSLEIARSIEDLDEENNCLTNIAAIYIDIGNYDLALEYSIQALNLDKRLNDSADISKDLNNIGSIFRRKAVSSENKKDYLTAIDYYNESLRISSTINDINTEIKVLNNLGTTYSYVRENNKALENYHIALKKADKIHDIEEMSIILNNIGIVYAQLGNYQESTKYYQEAINLASEIKGGKILWEAYLEMANADKNQNKYINALINYQKSISVIENIRSGINLEEQRATYLGSDKRIDAYHNMIDLLIRLNRNNQGEKYKSKAFSYFEKAKARSFLDSIELSKLDLTQGINQKLLNKEAELMNEISGLHTRLLAPQLTVDQKNNINRELNDYEEQLESLKSEMREASPVYANIRYPKTITLAEVQSDLLDNKTAFFAYLVTKENSYAFVITQKELRIFSLPQRENLQKLVREYLKAITDVQNQDFHIGYELYNALVRPGLDKNIKKIVFVPDDTLYFLPFETLLTKEQGKEWLIQKYDVAYAPSLSSLHELIERKKASSQKPKRDILALGDPSFGMNEIEAPAAAGSMTAQYSLSSDDSKFYRLKYSGLEIDKIGALFKPDKREILHREQASEENIKSQNLRDFRIIHFATHAIIDDRKPARSAIVLSLHQNPKEDGFLQMREVFNLKLNADLVTLSACQTGLGQLIKGEGIEGLSRAFFYAGASSVLLSLWAVNDQASYQLLERFYFYLRSSNSIMDALRQAKLELIDSGVLSHPYYWGGFVATGDAERIVFPHRLNRVIAVTLSLCAGLAILLLVMNREKSLSASPKKPVHSDY